MSIDIDALTTLTGIERVNAIAAYVETLRQDQRGPSTRVYMRNLPKWEAAELRFNWNLHARDSQSPDRADALDHAVTQLILNYNPS